MANGHLTASTPTSHDLQTPPTPVDLERIPGRGLFFDWARVSPHTIPLSGHVSYTATDADGIDWPDFDEASVHVFLDCEVLVRIYGEELTFDASDPNWAARVDDLLPREVSHLAYRLVGRVCSQLAAAAVVADTFAGRVAS